MYTDRWQAGEALAKALDTYRGRPDAIVLAIPRGGAVIGFVVAGRLGLPLDLLLAKKIGHPLSPETAIGAVDAEAAYVDEELVARDGISREYLRREIAEVRDALRRRERLLRGDLPPAELKGRTVIIVDDGIATGSTMLMAARVARRRGAARVVLAAPVAAAGGIGWLRRFVDGIVCPTRPESLGAIGQYYEEFQPVEDEAVRALVRRAAQRASSEV